MLFEIGWEFWIMHIDTLSATNKLFSQYLCVDAFSVCFVYSCFCVLCHWTKKMLIVISGFAFIYKYIFLVKISNFHHWQCFCFLLFLLWETRKSTVCTAFFIRKTNLLDFKIKIGTWLSLSRFDQSLVRYCLSSNSVL